MNQPVTPFTLLRPRRGFRVHAVAQGRFTLRSLCDTGPTSVLDASTWAGSPSEVTCPQCLRRLAPVTRTR